MDHIAWAQEWTRIDDSGMPGHETCDHIWKMQDYNDAEIRTCSLCGRVEERFKRG